MAVRRVLWNRCFDPNRLATALWPTVVTTTLVTHPISHRSVPNRSMRYFASEVDISGGHRADQTLVISLYNEQVAVVAEW